MSNRARSPTRSALRRPLRCPARGSEWPRSRAVRSTAARLRVYSSAFVQNNATFAGGGLFVDGATVILSDGTSLDANVAPAGASVVLLTGVVAYTLPAPRGRWIANAFPCTYVDGLAQSKQPCQLLRTLPELDGTILSLLPVGGDDKAGGVDEDYPYHCGAGFFGDSTQAVSQTSMSCSGLCPAGYMCPSGTAEPQPCDVGGFCTVGSSVATRCVDGTYSMAINLTSSSQCLPCPSGHTCSQGTKWPCGERS